MFHVANRTMDVVKETVGGHRLRALRCTLTTDDGRSAVGLSPGFSATEAVSAAYEHLLNAVNMSELAAELERRGYEIVVREDTKPDAAARLALVHERFGRIFDGVDADEVSPAAKFRVLLSVLEEAA